jgi:dTMP kinase
MAIKSSKTNMKKLKKTFSLEGIDGSGKTTQIKEVSNFLKKIGYKVLVFKSPSDTLFGNFISANVKKLEKQLLRDLFLLDIKNQQKSAKHYDLIIWDRYVDSFYSSDNDMLLNEYKKICEEIGLPEKTFFLDLNPNIINRERKETIDHHVIKSWQEQKRKRYLELKKLFPNRIKKIDANSQILEIKNIISKEIINIIKHE